MGYVSSVLTSVCASGAEIECRLIIDGDVRCSAPLPPAPPPRFPFERVRESRLSMDADPPECEGWCRRMRLRRSEVKDGRESLRA